MSLMENPYSNDRSFNYGFAAEGQDHLHLPTDTVRLDDLRAGGQTETATVEFDVERNLEVAMTAMRMLAEDNPEAFGRVVGLMTHELFGDKSVETVNELPVVLSETGKMRKIAQLAVTTYQKIAEDYIQDESQPVAEHVHVRSWNTDETLEREAIKKDPTKRIVMEGRPGLELVISERTNYMEQVEKFLDANPKVEQLANQFFTWLHDPKGMPKSLKQEFDTQLNDFEIGMVISYEQALVTSYYAALRINAEAGNLQKFSKEAYEKAVVASYFGVQRMYAEMSKAPEHLSSVTTYLDEHPSMTRRAIGVTVVAASAMMMISAPHQSETNPSSAVVSSSADISHKDQAVPFQAPLTSPTQLFELGDTTSLSISEHSNG